MVGNWHEDPPHCRNLKPNSNKKFSDIDEIFGAATIFANDSWKQCSNHHTKYSQIQHHGNASRSLDSVYEVMKM